jgi:hypothetical protein
MEKMNPEAKAKWLEALRSGEYVQTHLSLRDAEDGQVGYCCLGVLCDISGLGEWQGSGYKLEDGPVTNAYLPREVQQWAGLIGDDPAIGGAHEDRLSWKNDNGATFSEIADLIEKNF